LILTPAMETIRSRYARIALAGGPRSGKSSLAPRLGRPIIHTDDYIGLGWSEASSKVAEDANARHGPLVIEGVAVPRALRKGMKVDVVVWLPRAWEPLSAAQQAMAKGCRTVLDEWARAHPHTPLITIEVPDVRAAPIPSS
jgi:hypothetical protein